MCGSWYHKAPIEKGRQNAPPWVSQTGLKICIATAAVSLSDFNDVSVSA
jgi:hypothetical protein